MKKSILSILLIFLTFLSGFSTHNRAGEIFFVHLGGNTFKIIVTTYTWTLSLADRDELEVFFGDGTSAMAPRVIQVMLPGDYYYNRYEIIHTYAGPGNFNITMCDPNRNADINNIPGSVNVVFCLETILVINPWEGYNNTPILLYPPIDSLAQVGQTFYHFPTAFDSIDISLGGGDSISYELDTCLTEHPNDAGQVIDIPNYTYPPASNSFYVDPHQGLIWDAPTTVGKYNVAIKIKEWRNGIRVGEIRRDMQIDVREGNNHAPQIPNINDICVTAGTIIQFDVTATDADNDGITLSATGGPIDGVTDSPAQFPTQTGIGTVTSTFYWQTNCSHVRKYPYSVTFIAEDNNSEIHLKDIETVFITVVAPAPVIDTLIPTNNTISVYWEPSICPNAQGYKLYRREGSSGWTPDTCETGVPAYTGYSLIAKLLGINNITYLDNNNGQGLNQSALYCYRVIAYFADSAESYASEEKCTDLVRGIPIITNVSVNYTHQTDGSIYLAWAKPSELDTQAVPGPYKYKIYRSPDLWGQNLILIDSTDESPLLSLTDTIYTDTLLNTKDHPNSYKVELYSNNTLIGSPQIASSVFLDIQPSDNILILNFLKNVPWINEQYIVYKQDPVELTFDSIGYTSTTTFTDTGLINGTIYCYKVKSIGGYTITGVVDPIINYSQINCKAPKDTIPPCSPTLTVTGDCDLAKNYLSWTNPNNTCSDDVVKYNIYYSPTLEGDLQLIGSIGPDTNTHFTHSPTLTMAACYVVTAVDSFGNESAHSVRTCVDYCTYYNLPNVFTPDGDNWNDIYMPIPPVKFVEKVDMHIFNRWGVLIFETQDININWDGRNMLTNEPCPDGVYYYVCDVYERRLIGLDHRTLVGYIHIFRKEEDKKKVE